MAFANIVQMAWASYFSLCRTSRFGPKVKAKCRWLTGCSCRAPAGSHIYHHIATEKVFWAVPVNLAVCLSVLFPPLDNVSWTISQLAQDGISTASMYYISAARFHPLFPYCPMKDQLTSDCELLEHTAISIHLTWAFPIFQRLFSPGPSWALAYQNLQDFHSMFTQDNHGSWT